MINCDIFALDKKFGAVLRSMEKTLYDVDVRKFFEIVQGADCQCVYKKSLEALDVVKQKINPHLYNKKEVAV